MKRKILIFVIFVIAILALGTTSYAGSQRLSNLKYDVTLNANGSANVTETWDIKVEDTNTLFKTFELDSSKYSGITNVKVSEITNTGEQEFVNSGVYAYHVDKGKFYALERNSKEFEIAWGVSIENTEYKTYKISYTINNAVKSYNDCSEFYWQFIGNTNGIYADKVTGTINLPKSVSTKDNLRAWAHGPLNGNIEIVNNGTVKFEVEDLDTETMVEVRVVSLENIFASNSNIVNENNLDSILAEEAEWANKANEMRERALREQEVERNILKFFVISIIIISIIAEIVLIFKIVKYVKVLHSTKVRKPEQELQYFREIPDENATPAEAAFLYYFDKRNDFNYNVTKIVSAIILDLALKKAIMFEEENKKVNIKINSNYDKAMLKSDELSIYELLCSVQKYVAKKSKIPDEEIQNVRIEMKDIENYAKKHDKEFLAKIEELEKKAMTVQETVGNYDKKEIRVSDKWASKSTIYFIFAITFTMMFVFIIPLFIAISCFICGIITNKIAKRLRVLTQKGLNEQEKWRGLKRYMEDFSLLNEREVPELVLWEKYLVYATAFGIADKVLEQLKVKYPEFSDETYMMSNGYAYMYMINRCNLNNAISSGMQKAYTSGINARAARNYSSSGGYRRWFLRRRPEVVGGGRTAWEEDKKETIFMNPIIKWAGGKEKELPYIKKNLPSKIDRYIEPFVGGGAVYFGLNIENSIINDKSEELINLYRCIKNQDKGFLIYLKTIYKNWVLLKDVVENNANELLKLYRDYCKELDNKNTKEIKGKFNDRIYAFVISHAQEFNGILSAEFNIEIDNFIDEIVKNLISKMKRMHKIESQKKKMNEKDTLDNIECAFKSAFYMHFRHLYNEAEELNISMPFYTAIFYFIREFCYASMFRYNNNGKFNVPYGGISYNRKEFIKKINYINSKEIKEYMTNTEIHCDDFEKFLKEVKPQKRDFIFVDPPYDTEFSTYARNEFVKDDQIRLCEYLKNTKANIMLIIKNTKFIYDLYNTKEFNIKTFDKKYLVSFQNRNDKDVEHLLITNY